ncbi:magnesium transporter [Hominifimenecus microfluidus]|uniref:Magnesium transporter MgtE n=1 Tax=Hominifimenecus microfluidus TaxID=2885348 RepID=A0AAE3E6H5_9FIRM|nr:magnesium transporter [Hominifimenecus microfluidus]MCC2229386.1 magnesium transporter [Hominifimenecus microfluidus]
MENKRLNEPDYIQELVALIRSNRSAKEIADELGNYHENDIADAMEELNSEDRRKLYQILNDEDISDIFSYLDDASPYLEEIGLEHAADIIQEMDADDAVDLLEEMDDDKRKQLIDLMDKEYQDDIRLISSYKDDQIGSKMTTNYVEIRRNLTVKQAMRSLIAQAEENDNISTIYVCDDDDTYYGAIALKDLIIARDYVDLDSLISQSFPYVRASEEIDECIERLKDYAEDSIPVLDDDDKLIGVITSQEIIEVVDDEMGEDYAKLAGLTAEEDLNEKLSDSMKKRLPWLIALLGLGMVVSTVVGMFESVVSQVALIVCFQSLILDMAGNVGTQSLAVTIRVLMDEKLKTKEKVELIFKEIRIGMANGTLLGVLAFVCIGGYIMIVKGKPLHYAFAISACVGVALLVAMIISSFVGTVIPMFFHKINVDPAVASGPLITTINDLVAVVVYYGLAWILLINIMQVVS